MTDSRTTTFKTVDPERQGTTAEEIAVQLRGMIHRGELRAGDRLPPERDLAKMLGVSRPTLRAGISSLAAVGVLRSRPGAGTFVVEPEGSPSLDSGPLRMMASLHGFTPAEMFEARMSLEMAIAGLAAERATGEQMATMAEEMMSRKASELRRIIRLGHAIAHAANGPQHIDAELLAQTSDEYFDGVRIAVKVLVIEMLAVYRSSSSLRPEQPVSFGKSMFPSASLSKPSCQAYSSASWAGGSNPTDAAICRPTSSAGRPVAKIAGQGRTNPPVLRQQGVKGVGQLTHGARQ